MTCFARYAPVIFALRALMLAIRRVFLATRAVMFAMLVSGLTHTTVFSGLMQRIREARFV